jgi:hypothetical protein
MSQIHKEHLPCARHCDSTEKKTVTDPVTVLRGFQPREESELAMVERAREPAQRRERFWLMGRSDI